MTKTSLDAPGQPASPMPDCGCCGKTDRKTAELGLTPGVYICRPCAL